jgi:hypothetical protein
MERLGREQLAFSRELARQVRSTGTIDSHVAGTLARITGAPMFMSLRIDEWDVVDGRAEVELTSTLVDSTGHVLWKIRGRAGDGGSGPGDLLSEIPTSTDVSGSASPHGSGWSLATLDAELRIEPQATGDLERALRSLVSRWIPAMPMGDPDSPGIDLAVARLTPPASEH